MPTYQYACTACGAKHEAVQSFTDAHLTDCPTCGGLLRKVFSAVGVVFKGSGFYKNDSRGDKKDSSPSSSPAPVAASSDGGSSSSAAPAAPASTPAAASAPATSKTPATKTPVAKTA